MRVGFSEAVWSAIAHAMQAEEGEAGGDAVLAEPDARVHAQEAEAQLPPTVEVIEIDDD